nr:LysR family transcriptional regulator [uncultured Gellertiella sp.]
MHWDLRQARTFIAVAEVMSFSGAANILHTTQSAVSRTVAKMEADLNLPLLSRTTRSVKLTPEGRLLLEECREVVAHFDRWIRRAKRVGEGMAGEVAIGVNDFAVQAEVPHILNRFRARFPEIRFRYRSATREGQVLALEQGAIDVGFAMGPFSHPDYNHVRTGHYGLNAMMHVSHPLARSQTLTIAELAGEPLILGGPDLWKTYFGYLTRVFEAAQVPIRIGQEVEESVAIFGLVAAGAGLTIYPDCQQYLSLRDVVSIPISGLAEGVETLAIWSPTHISQASRLFIEFMLAEQAPISPQFHA